MSNRIPEIPGDQAPTLELERYFAGATRAYGLVHDRFGRLRRRFTVDMVGRPQDGGIELEESFRYDDGQEERRVWHVRRTGSDTYSATAADVVGTAEGRIDGPMLSWRYVLSLPIGGRRYRISFDDRMVLHPGGVLLNYAVMRKWGIRLGDVTLAFVKRDG